ncbi:MAG TPA: heme-binding beta-barrel domain-containing protein [Reyranella sp.]|nr:heme-binding beta-barrel domain-containing protein [Reyranella sp.]
MSTIPDDVFTEPENVPPDTLANLGPLRRLAGVWQSDHEGVDVSPKAAGPERRVYREHIRMEPIDPQANGPQLLYGLRYHIHIDTAEELITFHDQVGYWLWEPATGMIMQTIAIPRGQVVLAGGKAGVDDKHISVEARRGDMRFGICSTTFLEEAFRTDYYRIDITFNDDGSWTYVTRTDLAVRGKEPAFNHHDTNTLRRIAPPTSNPLVGLLKGGNAG